MSGRTHAGGRMDPEAYNRGVRLFHAGGKVEYGGRQVMHDSISVEMSVIFGSVHPGDTVSDRDPRLVSPLW